MEQSAKAAAVRRGVESSAASKEQKKVCGCSGLLHHVSFVAYIIALHCVAAITNPTVRSLKPQAKKEAEEKAAREMEDLFAVAIKQPKAPPGKPTHPAAKAYVGCHMLLFMRRVESRA